MSKSVNQLILMSDEHTRKVLGCYGNTLIKTPNLDRLAARGTLFTDAYTPCPICVPARASFATGKYGHSTGHWDNATPYTGEPHSWGHVLQDNDITIGSIGKLHYRNVEDPTGLDFQEIPMHLVQGIGDVLGCVREPLPKRWKSRAMAEKIGPGETGYTSYDRDIAVRSASWLQQAANNQTDDKPWVLFVSMVTPHFPLMAPQKYYDLYADSGLMPKKAVPEQEHEWMEKMRECFVMDNFTDEKTHIALTSYYGLVSFMDAQMGVVLDALDEAGLSDNTQVIYTSDHGDNIGERGLWGKSNLLEESVGVPMIMTGPDIPEGHVCRTPVNLTDVYPTLLKTANIDTIPADRPGQSLVDIANNQDDPDRIIFSEYHAAGACTGAFMIRKGRWKYIHYVGLAPQLFDLDNDPEELNDLGNDPQFTETRTVLEMELRDICDLEKIDAQAKADQQVIIEKHGGQQAVIERGGFGATPAPGEQAVFA